MDGRTIEIRPDPYPEEENSLKLDPILLEIFRAQYDMLRSTCGDANEKYFKDRRDRMLGELTDTQRRNLWLLGHSIQRLVE